MANYRVSVIVITRPRPYNELGTADEWIYVESVGEARVKAAEIEKQAESREFKRRVLIAEETYLSPQSY